MKKGFSILMIQAIVSIAVFAAPVSSVICYQSKGSQDMTSLSGILAGVSAAALKRKGAEVRILKPAEAAMIRGGLSSGGGGGKGGSGGSSSLNISLDNVPYVTQFTYTYNGYRDSRSEKYCGIASALMVRGKYARGASSAPVLYDANLKKNIQSVHNDIITIDNKLMSGDYGYNYPQVDVYKNKGLLYIGGGSNEYQYNTTVDILGGVFLGLRQGRYPDGISTDNKHISSVSMMTLSAKKNTSTKIISDVTKEIWNHIDTYRQPVVVVVDSNRLNSSGNIVTSSAPPTLHYIVIRGIKETGGIRYFKVHNPAYYSTNLEYAEKDLLYLMAIPPTPGVWVYDYGREYLDPIYRMGEPAYILIVQGD